MSPAKKTPAKKSAAAPAKKGAKPAKKSETAKPAKPGKVPIAFVRKLEAALGQADGAQQCGALWRELAPLGAPRDGLAAAAVLAHTKQGAKLARAFLGAIVDGTGADEVVRYCATLERGRSLMRGAFVRTWRAATDFAALDAAYENFAKAIVDDPQLLEAGVEAARRLGDSALADREARLARATRLAPLVADLGGAAPARARAAAKLRELDGADRAHVHARVIDHPRNFDEDVAVAAVLALADDPRITDMSLAAAIVDMRYHGEKEIVAAWQPRVKAGDGALITRLLGLFEWTSLWATDDDHLEPYIHALWPAGGRPEVFAHIEGAMASPNMVVREAVCEEWIREAEGRAAFDDAQMDKLVRSAVAIAEGGDNTDDRRAANRALFYVSHPGARRALFNAIRYTSTAKNDKLRWNIYHGLGHIDHPEILPFLVEQLFVERDEYWALLGVIGERLDSAAHRTVLATLAQRAADPNAIHAACAYADVLLDKKPSPRLLVELARAVLPWRPPTNDDGRRLRHIFEEATLAALATRSPDDARAFVARANALPASPYSDYQVVDRDQKTGAPFADKAVQKQLAALAAGTLDKEIAEARAAADAARKAGTPLAADDARLGALAGCTVKSRLLDDKERKVVWFFDEVGELHVYDGYTVAPMVLELTGISGRTIGYGNEMAEMLDGQAIIDERITMFDAKHTAAREVLRIGARVLVFDGRGKDYWGNIQVSVVGLRLGSYTAARDAVARLAANPPAGLARVDSWYIAGAGAVRREYYAPKPGGGYNSDGKARLAVLGARIDGRLDEAVPALELAHSDAGAAVRALQAWEGKLLAGGGRITGLWVDTEATRREDTTLAAFLDERYREDTKGAAWHLRAFADMMQAIDQAHLRPVVPEIEVTQGPPATDAEIAAYQALVPEPLPAPLVEVWREVGGAGFKTASTTARFFSPAELVANRAAQRDNLRAWANQHLKGTKLKPVLADLEHTDVLATVDGAPAILFDTRQGRDDQRCFSSPGSGWWEKALGWQIATDLAVLLERELERRVGDIYRLKLGERASDGVRRARLAKGDKEYEAIVDGTQLVTRTLTAKSPGKPSVKTFPTAEAATRAFDDAVAGAKKKGFT